MSWYGKSIHQSLFGKGEDGVVVISVNTVLSGDMYYKSLVVNAGVTLSTRNYRIYASSFVEINGTVENNGVNGAVTTGGFPFAIGTLQQGTAGGNGGITNGSVGGVGSLNLGAGGGKGGNGSGGSGGNGGVLTSIVNSQGGPDPWLNAIQPHSGSVVNGNTRAGAGVGGGGGAGNSVSGGGGGGSGGGIILISAPKIFGTGSIQVNGGNGANATNANTGGGGGGGAGRIYLISCNAISSTSLTFSGSGGTGGTGNGTGTAGANGSSSAVPTAIKVSL